MTAANMRLVTLGDVTFRADAIVAMRKYREHMGPGARTFSYVFTEDGREHTFPEDAHDANIRKWQAALENTAPGEGVYR